MDSRLKPCTLRDGIQVVDRLSSLPDEVLIQILSLLPTKYAAATCVLSRRLYRVFPWITILDFDDLPICHCVERPFEIERLPTYVTFVHTVLQAYKSQYLTRFRLRVGPDFYARYFWPGYLALRCASGCLPDLEFTQINSWIRFPLKSCGLGLRELDLCVHARCDGQLPPEIFTCETLEVLKLDVSLSFDRVSTFCLPRWKLLQLYASLIPDDVFLTRYNLEEDFEQMLNLIRPLSNVQHLALSSTCNKHLNNFDEVKDKLPLFPNLKFLELGNLGHNCWDKVLLAILNCSPILETLTFPQGMTLGSNDIPTPWMCEQMALEEEFCRTTQEIPLCCKSHLRSIVIKEWFWTEREIYLIQFLLRHALVLEELVVWRAECLSGGFPAAANHMTIENALKNYPRASVNCSIQVR